MGLGISASACGRCHACACVFVCICMRIHMCVGIYIYVHFFCSECYMHFTGVVGTSAWAGVCVTQVCKILHQRTHLRHTRCRLCTYVYMYISVYMHAYEYRCVCASMILLDTLRRCYWDFLSVHTCAYACVCICVCMYVCIGACVYVCTCIYVCLCICTHIHLYRRACGCMMCKMFINNRKS